MKTKRKILTRIEASDESGMPEIQITNFLDLGSEAKPEKLKTQDILFLEEFCEKTGLSHFVEPKKQWRESWKTQKALRTEGGKFNA